MKPTKYSTETSLFILLFHLCISFYAPFLRVVSLVSPLFWLTSSDQTKFVWRKWNIAWKSCTFVLRNRSQFHCPLYFKFISTIKTSSTTFPFRSFFVNVNPISLLFPTLSRRRWYCTLEEIHGREISAAKMFVTIISRGNRIISSALTQYISTPWWFRWRRGTSSVCVVDCKKVFEREISQDATKPRRRVYFTCRFPRPISMFHTMLSLSCRALP